MASWLVHPVVSNVVSPDLSRRILPALLVTVLSSAALGALVVSADVASEPQAMPLWFGVAPPHMGDGWRYNITLAGDWKVGDGDGFNASVPHAFAELHWVQAGTVRGGDGSMHEANRLRVVALDYHPDNGVTVRAENGNVSGAGGYMPLPGHHHTDGVSYWGADEELAWVLAGGTSYIQKGYMSGTNSTQTNYGPPGGTGIGASISHQSNQHGVLLFPVDESPCLATNALQGANTTVAQPIQLFGTCALGGILALPSHLIFHAAGIDVLRGVQSLRYEAGGNGTTYAVWFTPDIPYPVRLAVTLPAATPEASVLQGEGAGARRNASGGGAAAKPTGARSFAIDLTGFTAGKSDPDATDQPASRAPAPALVFAGRKDWGMDDASVLHPYPLSIAFQHAKDSRSTATCAPTWPVTRTPTWPPPASPNRATRPVACSVPGESR
jgi:hypothetical protein